MPTSTLYFAAVAAAAVAASAVASWLPDAPGLPTPTVNTERSTQGRPGLDAQGAYLPDLFIEEERAAPIEPLPPQF